MLGVLDFATCYFDCALRVECALLEGAFLSFLSDEHFSKSNVHFFAVRYVDYFLAVRLRVVRPRRAFASRFRSRSARALSSSCDTSGPW